MAPSLARIFNWTGLWQFFLVQYGRVWDFMQMLYGESPLQVEGDQQPVSSWTHLLLMRKADMPMEAHRAEPTSPCQIPPRPRVLAATTLTCLARKGFSDPWRHTSWAYILYHQRAVYWIRGNVLRGETRVRLHCQISQAESI